MISPGTANTVTGELRKGNAPEMSAITWSKKRKNRVISAKMTVLTDRTGHVLAGAPARCLRKRGIDTPWLILNISMVRKLTFLVL